ncbi:nicotinamide riboside transporter PnuC [Enterovibrio coralii]|uniref:Nicotinamide riboside transporter PnuC n=1 Tax=Enterovibrio coralii TaxID=294935 RepID=A0A135I7T8_9GAMM|nr:nicotinamide riboside transporter PnuC [Enterovibrio coralii]KXF81477.1 nicotinamide mononucleotide transporter [Enterovibrio coralii]
MNIFELLDINNTLVNIPIGAGGYAMSWIEAIAAVFGLLCIWFASKEKTINYLFGLLNVTLFAIIFYQIQLYALLLLQIFFFCANIYGWYAWTRPTASGDTLAVRWLDKQKLMVTAVISVISVALLTLYIDPVFFAFANVMVDVLNAFGAGLADPVLQPDAFPFWDSAVTVLSVVAQILMTRKYVENWLLWVVINIISVGLYAAQGVYVLSIQYSILLFIAANGAREWSQLAKNNKTYKEEATA